MTTTPDSPESRDSGRRASWLIWGSATGVEAVTYAAVNPGAPQDIVFLQPATASIGVALALWRQSVWSAPDLVEESSPARGRWRAKRDGGGGLTTKVTASRPLRQPAAATSPWRGRIGKRDALDIDSA